MVVSTTKTQEGWIMLSIVACRWTQMGTFDSLRWSSWTTKAWEPYSLYFVGIVWRDRSS